MSRCAKLALPLALAAAVVVGASGALATTAPSKSVTVLVLINDKQLTVTKFLGNANAPNTELEVMPGPVPRGDYLKINVRNQGKKPHNFMILGKKTKAIRPGGAAHIFVTAFTRGNFTYRSTLDKGPKFRGVLTVF